MTGAAELGAYLAGCRERTGLTVAQVAERSRIAPRLVFALEEGHLEALPAPVYVRGFLRSYCAEVGVAPDTALSLYEAVCPAPDGARALAPPAPLMRVPAPPWRRRWRRAAMATGVGLAVVAAGTAAIHLTATRRAPVVREAPAIREPRVTTAAAVAVPRERVLVVRVEETTWLRVRPGDGSPWEAILPPGSVREWRSADRFTLTVGNAGGVRLELDGRPLPALGGRGEVVRDRVIPEPTGP